MKYRIECCDNLELLNSISDNEIDLIYCDVLYGTGKRFKDYQDLIPEKDIIDTHYIPRINEMYRVLKNTGTLYLQCDIRINHWLRLICDNCFGYENFRNEIVVKYNIGGYGKNEFPKKHDYLLVYTKSNQFTFNDLDIRIPYKSVVSSPNAIKPNITQEKLLVGTVPTNVWDDIPSGLRVKKETKYFSEKHEKILERIVKCSSNENDLVADFYLGSGTTASVCKKLNRNFVGCDINPKAIEITNKRLYGG